MKRMLASLLMVLVASVAVFAADTTLPGAVTAKLEGDVPEESTTLSFIDEQGKVQEGQNINLTFNFPVDRDEWELSQTLVVAYSSNLASPRHGVVSFDVYPMKHDDEHVIPTSATVEAIEGSGASTDGEELRIDFPTGRSNRVRCAKLTITVTKVADQKLVSGSYDGQLAINMNEI